MKWNGISELGPSAESRLPNHRGKVVEHQIGDSELPSSNFGSVKIFQFSALIHREINMLRHRENPGIEPSLEE